jgi:signal transduction histidine kinase
MRLKALRPPVRRLLPADLRWRLALWVAGVLLLSAGVTFVVTYHDTGQRLRGQIDRDLRGATAQLSQSLGILALEPPARIAAVAARYVAAQPYRATSTLLFVSVPGLPPVSNHPELFGTTPAEPGESSSDQAAENVQARALLVPRPGFSTRRLPDVGNIRVLEQVITVGRMRVIVGAGEPLAIVEQAQHGVAQALILAGALTLALALIASYLAGARVSAPLRRMATVAARVDAGDLRPRMITPEGSGHEIHVLAESFNHMLDRLAEAFARQREFVADASHELRTPLTVIRGQLEVLAAQPDPPPSEVKRVERLVQAELGRIMRLVEDLLLLTHAGRTDFLVVEPVDLASFVTELWDGIRAMAPRRFELGVVPEGSLRADPDRLAQALHNLVANAVDHTDVETGIVRLEVAAVRPDRIRFSVVDNGPGIPEAERERIFERFHRTDAARARSAGGAGLGLAIVRAIVTAHGGRVTVGTGIDNGSRFELELPGFQLAPAEARLARR